jgi:hypothetical protein
MDWQGVALVITSSTALLGLVFPLFRDLYLERRRKREQHKDRAIEDVAQVLENSSRAQHAFSVTHAALKAYLNNPEKIEVSHGLIKANPDPEGFDRSLIRLESALTRYKIEDHDFLKIARLYASTPTFEFDSQSKLINLNQDLVKTLNTKLRDSALKLVRSIEDRI